MPNESTPNEFDRIPSSLEQTLAGFAPAAPQLDRDRLMFLAGAASAAQGTVVGGRWSVVGEGRGRYWLWPATTAALAATSLGLAVALFARSPAQPQLVVLDRPVYVQVPAAAPSPPVTVPAVYAASGRDERPGAQPSYLRTREVALRMGLDAIGSPSQRGVPPAAPPTYRALLEALDRVPSTRPNDRFPNM